MNLKRFQDPNLQRSFQWLFYAGLILFLLGEPRLLPTERTPVLFSQVENLLHWLGAGLLLLRIATLFPAYPRYALTCICMLVAFRSSFFLADPVSPKLYDIGLVMAASRGSDLKVNLRIFLAYLALSLIALPASYLLGWAGNLVKHIGSLQGSSFGFKSPNSLAAFIVLAVSVGLYLTKERRSAVVFTVCWSAAVLTFLLTLSRSQVLLLVVLPVLHLFLQKFRPKPWLLAALPFACLVLSVLLAVHYGPDYGSNTFASRFSIPALVYEKCGLSPFGQDCNLRGWFKDEFPYRLAIDNGYLVLFLCRGVFLGIAALVVMAHLLYLVGKKGDALLTAIACCLTVLGMMEGIPFLLKFSVFPLLYVPLLEELGPGGRKITLPVAFVLAFSILTYMFVPWHPRRDLPHPYGTLADIPVPAGFERMGTDPGSFSDYVENLPLARPDSVLAGYEEAPSDTLVRGCYRVVDFPLVDEFEQCADVCIRLRAEYLYRENRFYKIRFVDTREKTLQYHYGACRQQLIRYLRKVFAWSNTESLRASLPQQPVDGLAPGDIFVYEKDARPGARYGHAVMVAGIAVDTVTRQKAVLLIQGSTPACDIHVVANPAAPDLSPWHLLEASADTTMSPMVTVGSAVFYEEDIRRF